MTWHILYSSLERPCCMVLEVATARHGSWRHVVACCAHACLKIPHEGPHTAPYCLKAAQELLLMTWHIQYNSL